MEAAEINPEKVARAFDSPEAQTFEKLGGVRGRTGYAMLSRLLGKAIRVLHDDTGTSGLYCGLFTVHPDGTITEDPR